LKIDAALGREQHSRPFSFSFASIRKFGPCVTLTQIRRPSLVAACDRGGTAEEARLPNRSFHRSPKLVPETAPPCACSREPIIADSAASKTRNELKSKPERAKKTIKEINCGSDSPRSFTFLSYSRFMLACLQLAAPYRIARVSHGQKTTVPGSTTEAALDFDAIPSGGSSHPSRRDPQRRLCGR
jgi:hypothetical protein